MGTYGALGVGVGGGRRRWGGAWFALVLTFRKEGRDVGVKEEGKATANGFEEGFVGSGRGEDEAVKYKRGAPEMGRVVVGRGQSPDGAEDSTVRATVDRFGEVAGVGEEDCFGAVVEDVYTT